MKAYLNALGRINQKLAQDADEAVEVVYGIPVYMKRDFSNANDLQKGVTAL